MKWMQLLASSKCYGAWIKTNDDTLSLVEKYNFLEALHFWNLLVMRIPYRPENKIKLIISTKNWLKNAINQNSVEPNVCGNFNRFD